MCTMSMVMDSKTDDWFRRYYQQPDDPFRSFPTVPYVSPTTPPPTPLEMEEFRRLLDRAREYDKKNNQADCELEEKKQKLKRMADELGVKIDFT